MDISKIISRCKSHDAKAQRALLDHYSGLLYSVALRYAVDRSEAKDILQEGWIKIFKGISKYTEEGHFEAWMKRIVINVALRKLQGAEKRNATYVDSFYDEPQKEPEAVDSLRYDDLLRLVNQLPEVSREVFKMAAIDGMAHKDIGILLGIEASTSRAHLTRARKKLQELILKLEQVEYYGE